MSQRSLRSLDLKIPPASLRSCGMAGAGSSCWSKELKTFYSQEFSLEFNFEFI